MAATRPAKPTYSGAPCLPDGWVQIFDDTYKRCRACRGVQRSSMTSTAPLALQILLRSCRVGSLAMGHAIGDLGVGSLAGSRCTRRYGLGQRSLSGSPQSHSVCTPRCRCEQRSASSHLERVGRAGLRGSDCCPFGFDGLQVGATVSGLPPAPVILRMGHILHCTQGPCRAPVALTSPHAPAKCRCIKRPGVCRCRYYIIPTSPEMQLKVRNKLHEKLNRGPAESYGDDLEGQSYVFSDVGSQFGAQRPAEGSRVRFVLDKSRPGSFRALVVA